VGSGPAGVAAAITCSKAGLATTLVTRATFREGLSSGEIPLRPSESVHPGIISLLQMIDVGEAVKISSRSVYDGITVAGNHQPLGSDESGAWTGNHIDRILFDNYLLGVAKKQSVTLIESETVSEIVEDANRVAGIRLASKKNIRAKYVIDASGHKRFAGKKLKFKEEFYSPAFYVWSGVVENLDPSFFNAPQAQFIPDANGWSWLAPEPPDCCTWTRLSVLGAKEFHQPPELNAYGSTKETFAFNRRWRAFRPLVKEGLVLCGDAAAIIDPSAGQGILNALWSGIKAGQCVAQCISNPMMESFTLAQYDDWFMQQFEEKVKRLKEYYSELGIRLFE